MSDTEKNTARKHRTPWKCPPTANTIAAKALGIHPATLASYRTRGCPINDIDAARVWIADWHRTVARIRGEEP